MPYTSMFSGADSQQYVVTGLEYGPFATIQQALDQAQADFTGGIISSAPVVFVRPGTYTEDLTLYDNINIQGADESQVIIVGMHTPPAAGTFTISQCTLRNVSDIFNSVVAGTADIRIDNCTFDMDSGYIFNLPNWNATTGIFVDDCLEASIIDDIINNTGGSYFQVVNSGVGAPGGVGMTTTGVTRIINATVRCPVNIANVASFESATVEDTITIAGTGDVEIQNSYLSTGAAEAINTVTTGVVTITNTAIDSSVVNVIIGTSDVELASVTFLDGAGTAGVTVKTESEFRCNHAHATEAMTIDAGDFNLTNGMLNINGSTGTNGQVIIAATGANPQYAAITSLDGTIAVNLGANTIDLSAAGGANWNVATVDTAMTASDGYITKIAIPGLLTYTLPVTAVVGTILEITGYSAGLWAIAQGAGQVIHFGNIDTTPGAGGSITATNRYDSIRLLCVTADTEWNVLSSTGVFNIV